MDPRSPYLHPSRYDLRLHAPPAPPPHHSDYYVQQPPPLRPLPPPPAQQQYHTPLPAPPLPPPLNPPNVQFTYNNNVNPNSVNPNHPIRDNYYPQRSHSDFPRRLPEFDDYSREDRRDVRVLPDNCPYHRSNLDQEPYRRQVDKQLFSHVAKVRHEFEGNSRFAGEQIEHKSREDIDYHGRSQLGASRDFRVAPSQLSHGSVSSGGLESNYGTYGNRRDLPYDRDRVSENQGRVHDGEGIRDMRDLLSGKNSESGDGLRRFTGKREHYRSREANADFERHISKGSREGSHEFNRTLRKQTPKKSALLRITKPNHWNREDEKMHGSVYFDGSKSNSFIRGKDQNVHMDRGMREENREGSPVQLDVSFKSNTLVAKPIVTPPSGATAASDVKSAPRNSKVRKVLLSDRDGTSLSSKSPSISEKEVKQSKERVGGFGISSVHDASSAPGSVGNNILPEKGTGKFVPEKGRITTVSGKASSVKVAKKKKKVVKRVVRKVSNPNLGSSTSQPVDKCNDQVKACLPASSEADRGTALASADIVENEVILKSDSNSVDAILEPLVSEKVGSAANSDKSPVSNIKRKRSLSTSPQISSSQEESNEGLVNENLIKNLDATSNADNNTKNFAGPLNGITSSDIGMAQDINRNFSHDDKPFLLENDTARASSEGLLSVEGKTDFGSLNVERKNIQEGTLNAFNTTGFDNGLIISQEVISVLDKGAADDDLFGPCINEGTQSADSTADRFLTTGFPVVSDETSHPSNSGEPRLHNFVIRADSLNLGLEDTLPGEFRSFGQGADDVQGKTLSSDGVFSSVKNASLGESLKSVLSFGGSKEDTHTIISNNQNVEMPQIDLSGSEVAATHLDRANMINPAQWVDTTLRLSFKDPIPTEMTVSSDKDADVGLQTCTDEVDGFHWSSSRDVQATTVSTAYGANNVLCRSSSNNKRKFSDFQMEQFSAMSSDMNERPMVAGNSTSGTEVTTSVVNDLTQPEAEAGASSIDAGCSTAFPFLQKEITPSIGCSVGGHSNEMVSAIDNFEDEALICTSSSIVEHSVPPKAKSFCAVEMGDALVPNAIPVIFSIFCQGDSLDIESGEGERMDVDVSNNKTVVDRGVDSCLQSPELDVESLGTDVDNDDHNGEGERMDVDASNNKTVVDRGVDSCLQSPELDVESLGTDVDNDDHNGAETSLHSKSNCFSSFGDGRGVSVTNISEEFPISTSTGDELAEFLSDSLPDAGVSKTFSDVSGGTTGQTFFEKVSGGKKILIEKPAIQGGPIFPMYSSGARDGKVNLKSENPVQVNQSLGWKKGLLPSQESKHTSAVLNATNIENNGRKIQPCQAVSRTYPGRSSFVHTKNASSAAHVSKPRTWRRTDSVAASAVPGKKAILTTVPAMGQLPKKVSTFQNASYIRKGNSLVRKPTPFTALSHVSVHQLNSSSKSEVQKTTGFDGSVNATEPQNFIRTGGMNSSFERPITPPIPTFPKIMSHAVNSLDDQMLSPPSESLHSHSAETATELKLAESIDVTKSSDDVSTISESPKTQNGQVNTLESQSELNGGNRGSSNVRSITYVKRKSNQLVATSNTCGFSLPNTQKATTLSSEAYYKRRKNQLIRTSMQSQFKWADIRPDENLNSEGQTVLNISNNSKRRLNKVVTKIQKPSKFSLVWTLRGTPLSKNDGDSLHYQKVFPHLVPWKRATYRRNFMAHSSSSSTIRNLLLLRKRDTVYTRSKHGFSLRKSKVLSVDGFGLKWSKSIEKHSKKANEEATLAVAAAERKRRELTGGGCVVSGTKNRNRFSRERIFRVGAVRYRMDSSGRTLQRMSDDELSCSADAKTEKDTKKPYVPRRLVIGKNEYVRIGNGNQLIRDPKKRTRILASEKVRWSLHTARSRLARKRKYCQFFTRFGKCNKGDGKCPYIHDSSKIAVCTKFLKGLCSNVDCKLTHKVIPERMPDCSFYLQGLCTNSSCPYRHVHVNPNASTCEGFLRGYCADGNECGKKHSYVCPIYEATGSCPRGSKCKLHHPRNRSKRKKGKQSQGRKNNRGRYFGSMHIKVSDPGTTVCERHTALGDGSLFEGGMGDYLHLDGSDEDIRESYDHADERTSVSDSDTVDGQLGDLDELIKPIRIMNI